MKLLFLVLILIAGSALSQERAATAGETAAGIKHTPTAEENVRKAIEKKGAQDSEALFKKETPKKNDAPKPPTKPAERRVP